ncbi:hypothetical protein [Bradyrhizobium stylosanthis]|uniref:hypothetical protein n=1 Tax=Bradyrhizobium stylosanthis TaxID=1803665 RepID=UPI001FEED88E|nr:hypothetical protein [Bradyrhizobium stylosanthis]
MIGAPGGSYVAPAVAQGIMGVSNAIDISNRIRRNVSDEFTAAGYDVKRSPQTFPFAALHAIGIVNGVCSGGADPQRDGMAIAV